NGNPAAKVERHTGDGVRGPCPAVGWVKGQLENAGSGAAREQPRPEGPGLSPLIASVSGGARRHKCRPNRCGVRSIIFGTGHIAAAKGWPTCKWMGASGCAKGPPGDQTERPVYVGYSGSRTFAQLGCGRWRVRRTAWKRYR